LDDTVDLSSDKDQILELEKKFNEVTNNIIQEEEIWKAFYHYFHKYHLKKEPFQMMFEGQYYDLDFKPFKTKSELDYYCNLVAGSVGLMLLPILSGNSNEEMKKIFSLDLGRAMQYTNILRDVGEDRKRNRSYIPEEMAKDLSYNEIYEALSNEAMELYMKCQKNIKLFDSDSRYPLLLAIYYYRGILIKLIKTNFPNESRRIYLNKLEKFIVLLKAKAYYSFNKKELNI
jgi:phytoene synthase